MKPSKNPSMVSEELNTSQKATDSKPLAVVNEVDPLSDEVLMDLTEVTIMASTTKAYLVTKKGFQKWIPISTIEGGDPELEDGTFCEGIYLTEKAEKWVHKKPWEKLKIMKKGGGS